MLVQANVLHQKAIDHQHLYCNRHAAAFIETSLHVVHTGLLVGVLSYSDAVRPSCAATESNLSPRLQSRTAESSKI